MISGAADQLGAVKVGDGWEAPLSVVLAVMLVRRCQVTVRHDTSFNAVKQRCLSKAFFFFNLVRIL